MGIGRSSSLAGVWLRWQVTGESLGSEHPPQLCATTSLALIGIAFTHEAGLISWLKLN
jgi:hypothetical protein